jgi:hypothetical protein
VNCEAITSHDERRWRRGAVTLEFLIALPFIATFIAVLVQGMIMLHARTIVDYAAFAAARSAAVWVPTDSNVRYGVEFAGDGEGAEVRIQHAAAVACLPISVNLGPGPGVPMPAAPAGYGSDPDGPMAEADLVLSSGNRAAYATAATNVVLERVELGRSAVEPFPLVRATVSHDLFLMVPIADAIFGRADAPAGFAGPNRHFVRIVSSYAVPLEEETHAPATH